MSHSSPHPPEHQSHIQCGTKAPYLNISHTYNVELNFLNFCTLDSRRVLHPAPSCKTHLKSRFLVLNLPSRPQRTTRHAAPDLLAARVRERGYARRNLATWHSQFNTVCECAADGLGFGIHTDDMRMSMCARVCVSVYVCMCVRVCVIKREREREVHLCVGQGEEQGHGEEMSTSPLFGVSKVCTSTSLSVSEHLDPNIRHIAHPPAYKHTHTHTHTMLLRIRTTDANKNVRVPYAAVWCKGSSAG